MKTFNPGGVHPKENKLSQKQTIELFPVPGKVFIPLAQNLGLPPVLMVDKGSEVKVGQLIAKGQAFISANLHSSVSGKVSRIDDVTDQSGYRRKTIIIDVEGDDWDDSIDRSLDLITACQLSSEEIIQKIKEMGVVGFGGAAFPTHVKLMIPPGRKVEHLIINGAECEPFLTCDHRLMLERGEEILAGTLIMLKALKITRAFIGIENNKPDAIVHFKKIAGGFQNGVDVSIVALKTKYPQGGEKQLIKAIANREVPSGKLPLDVGCIVQNVGTAVAVYEAVQKNKPFFERVVTVTGLTLKKPSNYLVRIGTPVSELIEASGGLPTGTAKVISGGPMMGKALNSLDVPVVKGMSGILLLPEIITGRIPQLNCIRCARCISVCPMGLEPVLIAQLSERARWDDAEHSNVLDCTECGSCHYTCPSGRPLLDNLRLGKNKVGQIVRSRKKNN